MFRSRVFILSKIITSNAYHSNHLIRSFLSPAYRCTEIWNKRLNSPIIEKVNLNDLYKELEQNDSQRGVVSAIDVDIYANSLNSADHLEELRDLLHKLRLSADTGNTLDSTHYAAIRNYIEHGEVSDIISLLDDRLNYGIFLDEFSANILLDILIKANDYISAAKVASFVMLQEDFNNNITNALSLYSTYQYLKTVEPEKSAAAPEDKKPKKKVEEKKIRIKFLRNPYFDDHFDIEDPRVSSGKTLAWIGAQYSDGLNLNLQVIGWFYYKKYDKLLLLVENIKKSAENGIYKETLELLNNQFKFMDSNTIDSNLSKAIEILKSINILDGQLDTDLETFVNDSINKKEDIDIQKHSELIASWNEVREQKLNEQISRLDRAKRLQDIEEKQKKLQTEEQKLWFFENEENIDLQIESKIVRYPKRWFGKKKTPKVVDEGYVPPEIKPQYK